MHSRKGIAQKLVLFDRCESTEVVIGGERIHDRLHGDWLIDNPTNEQIATTKVVKTTQFELHPSNKE